MMVTTRQSLTLVLASGIILAKAFVDRSREPCPTGAIVNLTEETPEFFRDFPPEATWTEDDKTFGCPCEFNNCIEICCPLENAVNGDDCVKDELTLVNSLPSNINDRDNYLFINTPCSASDPLLTKYRTKIQDRLGSPGKARQQGFPEYCQTRKWCPVIQLVGICVDEKGFGLLPWYIACISVSTIFMLATFIVYAVIPELKNLHGFMFRCNLASYIGCMLLFMMFVAWDSISYRTISYEIDVIVASIFGAGFFYFGVASMMWLNVMSFDIWKTFRKFRPNRHVNSLSEKERQKKKSVRYSIYAWGGSAAFVISVIIALSLVDNTKEGLSTKTNIRLHAPGLAMSGIAVCNIFLYISTALAIKRYKKETLHIVDGMNKHHQENEQWFNLYMKLFILMGGSLIFWALGVYLTNKIFWVIVYVVESLQGISIFFLFVWKEDVKQLLRKRFKGRLVQRTLVSLCRSCSTTTTEC